MSASSAHGSEDDQPEAEHIQAPGLKMPKCFSFKVRWANPSSESSESSESSDPGLPGQPPGFEASRLRSSGAWMPSRGGAGAEDSEVLKILKLDRPV